MFNPRTFENARPDGFPVLEIIPPPREHDGLPEQPRQFVPLQRTELTGEVAGPVAALRLTQQFRFTSDQCPQVVEAVYRFPLPGDAAVTGVQVRFGAVEIRAELAERAAAEETYRTARTEGRQAALLTREAPDVFTLQVAGLAPDEEVTVRTEYVQLSRPEGDGWTLRVPLTTVPRYVRADERGSPHAAGQPLALLRDPGHRFALRLSFEGVQAVASRTHSLDVAADEGRLRVTLIDGDVLPDRDCVLTWTPLRQPDRPALHILRHDATPAQAPATAPAETTESATWMLALVSPRSEAARTEAVPREIILLIDHSGSMSGPKWEAADWAVQNLLAGLSPADTFNLGLFHSDTRWFARRPVRGDARTVAQARAFLLEHKDSGGTELGVALEQALGQQRDAEERARHVLIVTDAEVSDAGRILALAEREATRTDRRRVDVLCIDAAPNSGLALALAERGGGIARFLTSDPDANDIASALDEVLADWGAPVLHNLTLEVNRASVQAAGRRVRPVAPERRSIDLGDAPAGRAVWAAARIVGDPATPLTMRLLADGHELATELLPAAEDAAAERPAIAALFGARRVLDLELVQSSGLPADERLRQLGYDAGVVLATGSSEDAPPLYAENARANATDAIQALLVRESLQYGIVSSGTAFVAVRQEAGRRVEATVAVPNALAHGWDDGFLMARLSGAMPMKIQASSAPPTGAFMPVPFAAPPPDTAAYPESAQEGDQAPPSTPGSPGEPGLDGGGSAGSPLDFARGLSERLRRVGKADRGGNTNTNTPSGRNFRASNRSTPAGPSAAKSGDSVVFSGAPRFDGGEAVLFDSRTSSAQLPPGDTLARLRVRLAGAGGDSTPVDASLTLLLFVDDLAAPRARVRLADVLRQGGERPLNVRHQAGAVVRLVLLDPQGIWAGGAPDLEVSLG